MNNDILLKELIKNQRNNIPIEYKLKISDLNRISKNLNSSIFDNNKCCIWNGYITNNNDDNRAKYINFYFNKKKIALHRLLFINYNDNLNKNEYIKYTCNNKGICCNINHMYILEPNRQTEVKQSETPISKPDKNLTVNFD